MPLDLLELCWLSRFKSCEKRHDAPRLHWPRVKSKQMPFLSAAAAASIFLGSCEKRHTAPRWHRPLVKSKQMPTSGCTTAALMGCAGAFATVAATLGGGPPLLLDSCAPFALLPDPEPPPLAGLSFMPLVLPFLPRDSFPPPESTTLARDPATLD
eukprot:scaffold3366_cov365-Prasinococcus_capsulatus_cf.AAC.10